MGDVEWQNASDFPQSLPSLFFHAVILKQHERQRGSTLAAQFDLTSSEIKDRACKEGIARNFFFFFVGDQNFSHYVTKEYNSAGATLANPKGKASDSSSYPKLIKETTKSILGLQLKFCAWIKISDRYCGKNTKALSTTATQQRTIKAAN